MQARAIWIITTGIALALFALLSRFAEGPALLTAALMLSAVGVLALVSDRRVAILYGSAALALGQVCYILVFLGLSQAPLWDAFAAAPVRAAALVALALSTEIWLTTHAGSRVWPLRAGIALTAMLLLAALMLPAILPGAILMAAAGILLALRLFRRPESPSAIASMERTIVILFIAGQALILWASLAA